MMEILKIALQFIGAVTVAFAIFGFVLYKILVINKVRKEQEEVKKPHFIDQLLEQ